MVLVALAATGESAEREQRRKGHSVPPPASAFMPPASAAARMSTTHIIGATLERARSARACG